MNLPNRLTIFRIILVIPFIVFLKLTGQNSVFNILALLTFLIASVTDFLDGYIARKYDLVSDFGKLMDPLADKILVLSALILFVEINYIPSWIPIVIITREFLITGLRTLAASKGDVIPAGNSGKLKTISQMLAIILILILNYFYKELYFVNLIIMIIPVTLTVWSGYEYVKNGIKYFKE